MTVSRLVSRGAQPLSAPQSVFEDAPEFAHFEHLDIACEGPEPARDQTVLPQRDAKWSRIFAVSKSTLPRGKLYATGLRYKLERHTDGQSALSSCPPRET